MYGFPLDGDSSSPSYLLRELSQRQYFAIWLHQITVCALSGVRMEYFVQVNALSDCLATLPISNILFKTQFFGVLRLLGVPMLDTGEFGQLKFTKLLLRERLLLSGTVPHIIWEQTEVFGSKIILKTVVDLHKIWLAFPEGKFTHLLENLLFAGCFGSYSRSVKVVSLHKL